MHVFITDTEEVSIIVTSLEHIKLQPNQLENFKTFFMLFNTDLFFINMACMCEPKNNANVNDNPKKHQDELLTSLLVAAHITYNCCKTLYLSAVVFLF